MKSDTQASYQERILRVQVHIQAHLFDELALDDLARIACFSPYHFHRIFRGMVGETLAAHVRRLRLERTAQQLSGPHIRKLFDTVYQTKLDIQRNANVQLALEVMLMSLTEVYNDRIRGREVSRNRKSL